MYIGIIKKTEAVYIVLWKARQAADKVLNAEGRPIFLDKPQAILDPFFRNARRLPRE